MAKKFKLTQVEWELMQSVWALGEKATARQVHNHAFSNNEKAYTTVQTILNKLYEKGMLSREKNEKTNYYSATVSRSEMIKDELSFFITDLFDDSVPAFANFLIDANNLSLVEIESIKEFIDEKEKLLRQKDD